eukprot:m.5599 g.5599  ORF g.5599 m.5599 type:complete len:1522 (+) comp7805_c0_seq4:176-4741(+)
MARFNFTMPLTVVLGLLGHGLALSPVVYQLPCTHPALLVAQHDSLTLASGCQEGFISRLGTLSTDVVTQEPLPAALVRLNWLGPDNVAFQDDNGELWLWSRDGTTNKSSPILRGVGHGSTARCDDLGSSISLGLQQTLAPPVSHAGPLPRPESVGPSNRPVVATMIADNLTFYQIQDTGLLQQVDTYPVNGSMVVKQHISYNTQLYVLTADQPSRLVVFERQFPGYNRLSIQPATPEGLQAMALFHQRYLLLGSLVLDLVDGSPIQLPTPPLASVVMAPAAPLAYTVAYGLGLDHGLHVLHLQSKPSFNSTVVQYLLSTAVVHTVAVDVFHLYAFISYKDQTSSWLMTYLSQPDGSLVPRAASGVLLTDISIVNVRLLVCSSLLHVVQKDRVLTLRKGDGGRMSEGELYTLPKGMIVTEATMTPGQCSLFVSISNSSTSNSGNSSLIVLQPNCQGMPYTGQGVDWSNPQPDPESMLFVGPSNTVMTLADGTIRPISPLTRPAGKGLRLPPGVTPVSVWYTETGTEQYAVLAASSTLHLHIGLQWLELPATPQPPFVATAVHSPNMKAFVVVSATELWLYPGIAITNALNLSYPLHLLCPTQAPPLFVLPIVDGLVVVRASACDPVDVWRFNTSDPSNWAVQESESGNVQTTMAAITDVQAAAAGADGQTVYLVARAGGADSWQLYVFRVRPYLFLTRISSPELPLGAVQGLAIGSGLAAIAWDASIAIVELELLTTDTTLSGAQVYNISVTSTRQVVMCNDSAVVHLNGSKHVTVFPLQERIISGADLATFADISHLADDVMLAALPSLGLLVVVDPSRQLACLYDTHDSQLQLLDSITSLCGQQGLATHMALGQDSITWACSYGWAQVDIVSRMFGNVTVTPSYSMPFDLLVLQASLSDHTLLGWTQTGVLRRYDTNNLTLDLPAVEMPSTCASALLQLPLTTDTLMRGLQAHVLPLSVPSTSAVALGYQLQSGQWMARLVRKQDLKATALGLDCQMLPGVTLPWVIDSLSELSALVSSCGHVEWLEAEVLAVDDESKQTHVRNMISNATSSVAHALLAGYGSYLAVTDASNLRSASYFGVIDLALKGENYSFASVHSDYWTGLVDGAVTVVLTELETCFIVTRDTGNDSDVSQDVIVCLPSQTPPDAMLTTLQTYLVPTDTVLAPSRRLPGWTFALIAATVATVTIVTLVLLRRRVKARRRALRRIDTTLADKDEIPLLDSDGHNMDVAMKQSPGIPVTEAQWPDEVFPPSPQDSSAASNFDDAFLPLPTTFSHPALALEFVDPALFPSHMKASTALARVLAMGLPLTAALDEDGNTVIHRVVAEDDVTSLLTILDIIDSSCCHPQDSRGRTPLMLAVEMLSPLCFETLVPEQEDEIMLRDRQGMTVGHRIAMMGATTLWRMVESWQDLLVWTVTSRNENMLHLAAREGHDELLSVLLACESARVPFLLVVRNDQSQQPHEVAYAAGYVELACKLEQHLNLVTEAFPYGNLLNMARDERRRITHKYNAKKRRSRRPPEH